MTAVKELEEKINRNDLIYESKKHRYGFRSTLIIRLFGVSIFNGKITISEADKQQSKLLKAILQFKKAI